MANSSIAPEVRKPRPDFPLYVHKTGRWAKRVRGKIHYFGKTASDTSGQVALDLWLQQKDDLLAGRTPRVKSDGLLLKVLCNRFLTVKQNKLDTGEITKRTWSDYKATTDLLVAQFGKNRLVSDLASEDFERLRAKLANSRGPVALGNEIQRVRTVFRYGYSSGLLDKEMRFGEGFKKPSAKTIRIERAKQAPRMFEAADLQALLKLASPQLKAMILLGLNCAFGNNDCATLTLQAVDLKRGWIVFPRPKTGVNRRCPLWPQTVTALKDVLAKRKEPKATEHANLFFITKPGGSFAKDFGGGPVAKEFAKLVKVAKLEQEGRGFYALRHTFRTIADETRDFPAIDLIMGHADNSMADRYRERIDDARLKAVTDYVRKWLFARK